MNFNDFNFHPDLLEGIQASNYETATAVQQQVIPPILAGRDIIASAQTGTGKTAAFLLPIIHKLLTRNSSGKSVRALIIVPTRELAIQIAQHLEGLSYFTNLSSLAVYGGSEAQNFVGEKKALQMGTDIIVCTPGRFISHLNLDYVSIKGLEFLVLDEADRMLDMGFLDDIKRITTKLPSNKQTLLFSATMPPKIRSLAKSILRDPVEINISISTPPDKIAQKAYVVYEAQKLSVLKHILTQTVFKRALIFCSSKANVKTLSRILKKDGLKAEEIHSDLPQSQREDVLNGFTSGRIPVMVATDILSRGIDIDTIDLVINYDVPRDGEDYVHRIGRTARAEAEGVAFTLVGEKEQNRFNAIENLIKKTVEKAVVPRELGTAPAYQPRQFQKGKRNFYKSKTGFGNKK
ncbi:MAG: DEAD/DEAH box helicase [Chitinophagaceae bacterium]|nr:DEAD/DEAH box helicase [Chitinophagaceae bacterium]MCW5926388.1 DEAD/DEAH box helicase [Chitinophagaceae bacterium]